MIVVHIGNEQRSIDAVDSQWVNQQINLRRASGETVCVRVRIQLPSVDLILSTPGCASSGASGRPASEEERPILELWNKRGLNQVNFTGGDVIAFLKQLV